MSMQSVIAAWQNGVSVNATLIFLFGIEKFGKLDISTKEGKQRLIDGFINAIYVYDDKITFTFNYKDGTRTVMLSELSDGKSNSDLKCQGAPHTTLFEYFSSKVVSFCKKFFHYYINIYNHIYPPNFLAFSRWIVAQRKTKVNGKN